MSNHLTPDQISKWIAGQSTPEEGQHGRDCTECSAELSRFRESVATFRVAMQEWSERENVPKLEETSRSLSRQSRLQPALRWAFVTMTVGLLLGIPVYHRMNMPAVVSESAATFPVETAIHTPFNDDVLLMQAVNAHLSRPIPMPMERVMALLPNQDEQARTSQVPEGPEGKEVR